MNLSYTKDDLDDFLKVCDSVEIMNNGLNMPDMFTFYFFLKKLQPTSIIESGVDGLSIKIIRLALGADVKITCLDPLDVSGYIDTNPNTTYLTGSNFTDFSKLDLSGDYTTLCFFNDGQNAKQRMFQAKDKGFVHLFFNCNHPVNGGATYTIQHMIDNDTRDIFEVGTQLPESTNTLPQQYLHKLDAMKFIHTYFILPNVFPSTIDIIGGSFPCEHVLDQNDAETYAPFYEKASTYSWNTYVKLNSPLNPPDPPVTLPEGPPPVEATAAGDAAGDATSEAAS